ncbi:hypothetical protein GCM10022222_28990 [Amycolatopsis ultiminotia]|uniref:TIGR04086 family membrane protein n=1 Tax=Amycolatopsis ultiminotia TaxID=543629 RepID=A0ABP6W0F3_9PSEU
MVSKNVTSDSRGNKRAFAQQSTAARIVGAGIAPIAAGVVSGLLLGASAPAYWVLQVLAAVGGFLGGTEHRGRRPGLVRGGCGGLLYGVATLFVRALTGWTDRIPLGETPAFLVVVTVVVGALAGTLGGWFGARRRPSSQ